MPNGYQNRYQMGHWLYHATSGFANVHLDRQKGENERFVYTICLFPSLLMDEKQGLFHVKIWRGGVKGGPKKGSKMNFKTSHVRSIHFIDFVTKNGLEIGTISY